VELRRRVKPKVWLSFQIPIIFLIIFSMILLNSNRVLAQTSDAKPSDSTPDTVIEAPPIDVFTDRSGIWNSKKINAASLQGEFLNPYEFLNKIPGVQSRFEGSPTISIRGSQSLPRVLGLYNGVPLNGASGFGPNRLLIPQEALGEIRVFKGPASLFFGSDAMGGAINFISRHFDQPAIRGHIGSFNQSGLFGALPFAVGENQYQHITSYLENYDGGYPYVWASSGLASIRSNTNRSLQRHTFVGEQTRGRWSFGENLIWGQEIATTPGPVYSQEATHSKSSSGLASLNSRVLLGSDLEISHRIYGIKSVSEYRDSSSGTTSDNRTVGNSLNVRKRLRANVSTDFYFDHRYDDFKNTLTGDRIFTTNDTEISASVDCGLEQNLILKPGTRYLFTYKTFVSSIGLFEEHNDFRRWLTYSQGFHAPSLIQRFATYAYSIANPDLKPETSSQAELGFSQAFVPDATRTWNKAGIEANVFSIQYSNFIGSESVTATQTRPVNTGSARAFGVEIAGSYAYEVWKFGGNYTYLKTEDNQQNSLPFSPENQYGAFVGMSWAVFYMELSHTVWDKFYDKVGSVIPLNSWNSTDFTVQSTNLKDWKIKGSVLNIFDRPVELSYGYPEPQRRFFIGVERSI